MATKVTGKKTDKKVESKGTAKRKGFKITGKYEIPIPEGFNFEDHKPLKKMHFTDDAIFYEHKAAEMEFKMNKFLARAKEVRELGTPEQRRKKKQIKRLHEKMEELKAQLEEQGVDVETILANIEE